jgi:hypothetical protein
MQTHKLTTRSTRLSTPLKSTTSILAILLVTSIGSIAHAQTTCNPPNRCLSADRVNAVVDAACARARAAEARLPNVIDDLSKAQTERDHCRGELARLENTPAPEPVRRSPWWIRVALDVGIGALSAGTGAAAGIGAPGEVVAVGATLSAGALAVRLLLEFLDRQKK